MTQRTYLQLPINADEGFPQSFRLSFNGNTYQVVLYVNILEDGSEGPDAGTGNMYTLPKKGAFMVMRVSREDAAGATVIFQRKLVPNCEYEAQDLAFVFRQMRIARENLNGAGAFGSAVIGGIATRWAS